MARTAGIQIVKKVTFRGAEQEFSNVYHYSLPTATAIPAQGLVDAIVPVERDFHSTDVTFVRFSVWRSDAGPANNEMVLEGSLSGTGLAGTNTSMDRERAVLIQFPAGFSSTGKPVFLRKWYHSCGSTIQSGTWSASVLQNTATIGTTPRAAIATRADALRTIHAELWVLSNKTGSRTAQAAAQCHPYLEHRQLGEMWR